MPVPGVLARYFIGKRGTFGVPSVLCIRFGIPETAKEMSEPYISRAQLLLQYYAALGELAEEARRQPSPEAFRAAAVAASQRDGIPESGALFGGASTNAAL